MMVAMDGCGKGLLQPSKPHSAKPPAAVHCMLLTCPCAACNPLHAPSNARLRPTRSPSIVLVVCPQSGHILWQNSASCSAMGIIAAEVALPVAGSCEPCDMNYLQQVFWDNDVSAGQCSGCNAASVLVNDWKEQHQVAKISLWSKIVACRI